MDENRSPTPSEDHPRPEMRGAWILVFVVLASATTSLFNVLIDAFPGFAMFLIAILPIVGLLLRDYFKTTSEDPSRNQYSKNNSRMRRPESHAHLPFRTRLATYLHIPESEVLPSRPRPVSSMPFWSSVPLSPRPMMMKSVEFIRDILERIHAAVRG